MYLAKLGLVHWAIAAYALRTAQNPCPRSLAAFRVHNGSKLRAEYTPTDELKGLPHADVTSLLMGPALRDYMLTLYRALEGSEPGGGGRLCSKLETLKAMLKTLTGSPGHVDHTKLHSLYALAIYTSIAGPGARILVLNELAEPRE